MRLISCVSSLTFVAILLAFSWAPHVRAHSELVSADPEPGVELFASPALILLTFSEPIGTESAVEIFGPNFRQIEGIQVGFDRDVPDQVIATLPPLDPDQYTVQWTAVSIDGHRSSGSYAFSVTGTTVEGTGKYNWLIVFTILIIGAGIIVGIKKWQSRLRPRGRR